MKIQTNKISRFDTTTQVSGVKVEWDKNGEAEVSDKDGQKIIKLHDTIFEKGKMPLKEDKVKVEKDDSEQVASLKQQLNLIEAKLETSEGKVKVLEQTKEQLIKELEAAKNSTSGPDGEGEKRQLTEDEVDVIIGIIDANKEVLEQVATENELPEEEWKDMNKKQLAKYLILKGV